MFCRIIPQVLNFWTHRGGNYNALYLTLDREWLNAMCQALLNSMLYDNLFRCLYITDKTTDTNYVLVWLEKTSQDSSGILCLMSDESLSNLFFLFRKILKTTEKSVRCNRKPSCQSELIHTVTLENICFIRNIKCSH